MKRVALMRFAAAIMLTAALVSGCARVAMTDEANQRRKALMAPPPEAPPLTISEEGPYQATLNIGDELIARLAYAALTPRLNADARSEELSAMPYMRVDAVRVSFPGCDRCIAMSLDLEVGVTPMGDGLLTTLVAEAAEHIRTQGRLSLEGRIKVEARPPALKIDGLQVTGVELRGAVEADITLPRQLIEAGLRQSIDKALAQQTDTPSIPLPSHTTIAGQEVALTVLGAHTSRKGRTSQGQVVVGVTTQLVAAPTVKPMFRDEVGPREWGLIVGQPIAEAILQAALARERAPGRAQLTEVTQLRFDDDGIALGLTLWKTGWRPFRQAYGLTWTPTIKDGDPTPQAVVLSRGDGKGATRLAPAGEDAQAISKAAFAVTSALQEQTLTWPTRGNLKASTTLHRLDTGANTLSVIGGLTLRDGGRGPE